MNPNGGKSHLTPISHRLRAFTAGGSGGSFGFFAFGFGFGFAATCAGPLSSTVAATPHALNAAAAIAATAITIQKRFTAPLLLPRWSIPPGNLQAATCGAGNAASAPPSAGRARRRALLLPRFVRCP